MRLLPQLYIYTFLHKAYVYGYSYSSYLIIALFNDHITYCDCIPLQNTLLSGVSKEEVVAPYLLF